MLVTNSAHSVSSHILYLNFEYLLISWCCDVG